MKRNKIICGLLLALLLFPATVFAQSGDTEYIVKLDPYVPMLMALGDEDFSPVPYLPGVYVTSDLSLLEELVDAGAALYIEENQVLELLEDDWEQVPDEEPLPDGASDPVENWALKTVGCEAAKAAGLTGDGVCVAIIDSGLDIEHEDLKNIKISPFSRNMLGDGSGAELWYRDQKGHGSFVAGIIAAETGNGKGISSLACNAELMVLRVISTASTRFEKDPAFDSGSGTAANVAASVRYAADNGADVINISMGGANIDSKTLQEAVDYASEKGAIVVAAAGNSGGTTLYYPAACEQVIGAGATDKNDVRWSGSQHNSSVDAAAPGYQVIGIDIYPGGASYDPLNQSSTYRQGSGTSYSAPLISALAALVKETNPSIDHDGFLALLAETCADKGDLGRDDEYGYGRIDCEAMMAALFETERLEFLNEDGSPVFEEPQGFVLSKADPLTLPSADRFGYEFLGWYTSSDLSEEASASVWTADLLKEPLLYKEGLYTIEKKPFYARWQKILPSYDVCFYLYDGAPDPWEVRTLMQGEALGTLPQPSLKGSTFTGWYTRPGQPLTRVTSGLLIEEPLRIYAGWSVPPQQEALYAGPAEESLLDQLRSLWNIALQKLQEYLF